MVLKKSFNNAIVGLSLGAGVLGTSMSADNKDTSRVTSQTKDEIENVITAPSVHCEARGGFTKKSIEDIIDLSDEEFRREIYNVCNFPESYSAEKRKEIVTSMQHMRWNAKNANENEFAKYVLKEFDRLKSADRILAMSMLFLGLYMLFHYFFFYNVAYNKTDRKILKDRVTVDSKAFMIYGIGSLGSTVLALYAHALIPAIGTGILTWRAFRTVQLNNRAHKNLSSFQWMPNTPGMHDFLETVGNRTALGWYLEDGTLAECSKKFEELFGESKEQLKTKNLSKLILSNEKNLSLQDAFERVKKEGRPLEKIISGVLPNGEHATVLYNISPLYDNPSNGDGKKMIGSLLLVEDMTDEIRLKEIVNKTPTPVSVYSASGEPLEWNDAMVKLTGRTKEEVVEYWRIHKDVMTLLYKGEDLDRVKTYLAGLQSIGGYKDVAFTLTRKDGTKAMALWTTTSYSGGSLRIATVIDNAEDREWHLRKDPVFDCHNLYALKQDLHKLLLDYHYGGKRAADVVHPPKVALVFCDIDNFKTLNDKFSHAHADRVIEAFISFAKAELRDGDILYRRSGDEFVISCAHTTKEKVSAKINSLRSDFYNLHTFEIVDGRVEHRIHATKQEADEYRLACQNKFRGLDICKFGVMPPIGLSMGIIDTRVFDSIHVPRNGEGKPVITKEAADHLTDELLVHSENYMYTVKYLALIKEELLAENLIQDEKRFASKNALAIPKLQEGRVVGTTILGEYGEIEIGEELAQLICKRKMEKVVER